MSHDNWQTVWNRRTAGRHDALTLEDLMRLDGFDSGAAQILPADWRAYAADVSQRLNIHDGDSVFEIGCGAGAFLYALHEQKQIAPSGLDYAGGLIEAARKALPTGHFVVADAEALAPEIQSDFVIANSVFQYLPLEKAGRILRMMLAKARVAVAVLDIPDAKTQAACEQVRRAALPADEYEKKYAGLAHTYYDRDWFAAQAENATWICETLDGRIPNYAQNRFRFAALLKRRDPTRSPPL
jgi:trans-aconitate methyltransferase